MIFPDSVRLSGRWKMPVLSIQSKSYYPHRYLRKAVQFRRWRVLRRSADEVTLQYMGQTVRLSNYYFGLVLAEWHDRWSKAYLPPEGVNGKTILDVGAGEGETALFYVTSGARDLICVEPNSTRSSMLRENARANHWEVRIVEEPFSVEMLRDFSFDFAKLDCEGGEGALLSLDRLPTQCVIEAHGHELANRLRARFGLNGLLVGKETDILATYRTNTRA